MIEPPKLVESKYRAIYLKTRLENTTTSHSSFRKSSSDLSLQKSPVTKICLSPNKGYKAHLPATAWNRESNKYARVTVVIPELAILRGRPGHEPGLLC